MDSCSKLLHQKHGFFAELQHVLMLPQAAGRLIDCTSGEAKKSVILLHSFGETSYFEVYFFSRSCLIFNAPNSGNCCHFQAMRAGIMEFGGVHEEEEEADFVAAFGTHSALILRWQYAGSIQCFVAQECVAPVISCQKDLEVWQNLWSLATVCFESMSTSMIFDEMKISAFQNLNLRDIVQQKVLDRTCKKVYEWMSTLYRAGSASADLVCWASIRISQTQTWRNRPHLCFPVRKGSTARL